MAKIVKDTRKVMNVEEELKKLETTKKDSKKKQEKKKEEKPKKKEEKKKNKNKQKKEKKKSGLFAYFKSVKSEISKVKWPSKKDMIKYSIATIVFILFFAIFFYCIDFVIAIIKEAVKNG